MISNQWEKINVQRGLEYKILYIILNKIFFYLINLIID